MSGFWKESSLYPRNFPQAVKMTRTSSTPSHCFAKRKNTLSGVFLLVEATGVEPVSENLSARASPGAAYGQDSPDFESTSKLKVSVASFVMPCSKLCKVTFTVSRRPSRGHGYPRADGCT